MTKTNTIKTDTITVRLTTGAQPQN